MVVEESSGCVSTVMRQYSELVEDMELIVELKRKIVSV